MALPPERDPEMTQGISPARPPKMTPLNTGLVRPHHAMDGRIDGRQVAGHNSRVPMPYRWIFVAPIVLLSGLVLPLGQASAQELTRRERAAFAVPERDALKPIKSADRYLRSNETELHLFGTYIDDLGGGYVGVGADQNYTLAAMAKSRFVWLMDYDPWVVTLHRIYRALILETDTPAALVARWGKPDEMLGLLRKHYAGDPDLKDMETIYRRYRAFLQPYLRWSLTRKRGGVGTTWLSSSTLYDRVRTLWREGRFQPVPGDLHGERVFQGISAAARRLGIPMRIVYLSNAEMYLPYSKAFLANMQSVPTDARSLLVRTVRHDKYPMLGDKWHYNVQPFADDYLRRLGSNRYHRIYNMMEDFLRAPRAAQQRTMTPRGFSRFGRDIPTFEELLQRAREKRRR